MMPMTAAHSLPTSLQKRLEPLLQRCRDPQAWIAGLALITLLGLGTGSFEPAAAPEVTAAQEQDLEAPQHRWAQGSEQIASLDVQKL